jgi:nitrogen fixation NifU-like protein
MEDMYREIIVERYKNPAHFGELDPHDMSYQDENPLCGDNIKIDLIVKDDKVVDAKFNGHGCAISLASADLLLDEIIGKTLDEVKALTKENVLELLGIELGPVRLKCALLSLKVLKGGVYGLGGEDLLQDEDE